MKTWKNLNENRYNEKKNQSKWIKQSPILQLQHTKHTSQTDRITKYDRN